MSKKPHAFWDSDVAKWIEAGAYSLARYEDKELEQKIDSYIEKLAEAQLEDGYLNSYYIDGKIEKRWSDLCSMHELYCAGHLIEAAVAYHKATGKSKMLDIICRYADHIDSTFGPGKIKGYPGHEEIELALVKLWRATGQKRYLHLAKYFVDERGQQPSYFNEENKRLNRPETLDEKYLQTHIPVRKQEKAEGHCVRALYLYAGMADVAAETGDDDLLAACKRLWENIVNKRMYITGGVGSWPNTERFSADYDLPNNGAYGETCAAIGLIFFTHRMLQIEANSKYADVLERVLYNGMLSGVGLSGKHFFYANPLEAQPELDFLMPDHRKTQRQEWFGCSCCPPNIARLLASLGQYIYSTNGADIFMHLYIGSRMKCRVANQTISIRQQTNYPWDGNVKFGIKLKEECSFTLYLRIPDWCEKATVKINGKPFDIYANIVKGYAKIDRNWQNNDELELVLDMPVELIESNPEIRANTGCVAIQRGPIVYCLEEEDNGKELHNIRLPLDSKFEIGTANDLLDGAIAINSQAYKIAKSDKTSLYRKAKADNFETIQIRAIPYFLWANRSHGEMRVWIHKK